MVVGVQEQKLLFLQHQEYSVNQLQVLSQIVQVVQSNQLWCESVLMADSIEEAVVVQDWNQLLGS